MAETWPFVFAFLAVAVLAAGIWGFFWLGFRVLDWLWQRHIQREANDG